MKYNGKIVPKGRSFWMENRLEDEMEGVMVSGCFRIGAAASLSRRKRFCKGLKC